MQHTIAPDTMARLQERLDEPRTCPHGNPLPGHEGVLREWIPLTQTETGHRITFKRVHESAEENHDLMLFLEKHGLIPGTDATVQQIIPFNRTISLRVAGQVVVLGFAVAEQVYVQLREE